MKNSSSSRPLKQPSKRVLVKIIPGPNESALITGGALATLGHIDKAAALRARYMAYKRVDRRLQASQIDTGRRTRMTTSITKNNERIFRSSDLMASRKRLRGKNVRSFFGTFFDPSDSAGTLTAEAGGREWQHAR